MRSPKGPNLDDKDWIKRKIESDISEFKRLIEDAEVEHVDTPSARIDVSVVWEDSSGFHKESGTAIGVYRDMSERKRDGSLLQRIHIDWDDDRGRTTIEAENLKHIEEGDWYFD